jgi:hypothetical protein
MAKDSKAELLAVPAWSCHHPPFREIDDGYPVLFLMSSCKTRDEPNFRKEKRRQRRRTPKMSRAVFELINSV